jgi:tocopherol cyclase
MMKCKNPINSYFQGWYFKNQSEADVISLIPAYHLDEEGRPSASLQIITPKEAHQIFFPYEDFRVAKKRLAIRIGENLFTSQGIRLNIHTAKLTITGKLRYLTLTPPRHDIMGPFRYIPWMPCQHNLYSLAHGMEGELTINGERKEFRHGIGYIEGDQGNSFPGDYLWTQCSWWENDYNSLMLSVADLMLGSIAFTGCIGVIYYKWKEYRFATYLGVKIKRMSPNELWVVQGKYELRVKILDRIESALLAPVKGSMVRTVYESVDSRIHYRFSIDGKVMFDFIGTGCFERGL